MPHNQGGDPLVAIAAAHHWAAAGDDEEAFSSSLEAAAYASRLHAPAEAAALLHRALILWDSVHDPQSRYPAGRDELLCDTFAAYDAADQLPLVLPIVDAELAREAGRDDPQHALLLRLLHDEYGQYVGRPLDPRLLEQVRAAWPRLRSEPPSSMVFHALRWLGAELWPAEPALSLDACRQSVAVAGQLPNRMHLHGAVAEASYHLRVAGLYDEALEILVPVQEAGDPETFAHLDTACFRSAVLREAGRVREAERVISTARRQMADLRLYPNFLAMVNRVTGSVLFQLGEWGPIPELLAEAGSGTDYDIMPATLHWAGTFACHNGDLDAAQQHAAAMRAMLPADESEAWYARALKWRELEALIALRRGDPDRVKGMLEPPLQGERAWEYLGEFWDAVLIAAEAEGDRGSVPAGSASPDEGAAGVAAYRDMLVSIADRLPRTGLVNAANHRQASADLARAAGDLDLDAWAEVVGAWRAIEHKPATGAALVRLARAQAAAGDRDAVAESLSEAWRIGDELGSRPLTDAASTLARGLRIRLAAAPVDETPGLLSRLTERELEVLRHVAMGESNDELGTALFISPKTASVHVSRILTKLEVPSRAKATALAYEHGLMSEEASS